MVWWTTGMVHRCVALLLPLAVGCYRSIDVEAFRQSSPCPVTTPRFWTHAAVAERVKVCTSRRLLAAERADPTSSVDSQHQQNDGNQHREQQPQQRTFLFELRVKAIKIEALRFFLQLYLVGRQNDPVPRAWTTQQSGNDRSDDESFESLEVYYLDGTGMLSIELSKTSIAIVRCGDTPSLPYRLQESLLLHSLLDELVRVASSTNDSGDGTSAIGDEQRLVIFRDVTEIDQARLTLPARKS